MCTNSSLYCIYLVMIDALSEYLSKKYSDSAIAPPFHYQTIIIQKTTQMLHTFESLTREGIDVVSARCLLRGILDNIAVYCFIYERDSEIEVLFRHYLYALDGIKIYRDNVVNNIVIVNEKKPILYYCDEILQQLNSRLSCHPYSQLDNINVNEIINMANWRYETLNNPRKLSYLKLYKEIGFEEKTANYYQSFFSQFSHGLFLSNIEQKTSVSIRDVLNESIPIISVPLKLGRVKY